MLKLLYVKSLLEVLTNGGVALFLPEAEDQV